MKKLLIAMTCLPLFACGPVEGEDALTKADAVEMYENKTADGRDFCDEFGWYDDGVCDTFCPDADADCDSNAGYEPCGASSTCGDSCTLCDPSDPDCVESAVVKFCQADGSCDAIEPVCEAAYDPCDDATCGDSCTQCDPADTDCVETAEVKFCQPDGSCAGTTPTCGG